MENNNRFSVRKQRNVNARAKTSQPQNLKTIHRETNNYVKNQTRLNDIENKSKRNNFVELDNK